MSSYSGFSFGALLSIAVFAKFWAQPCITLDDLKNRVGCIVFGTPFIDLHDINDIFNVHSVMKNNCHLFYAEDDVFPQLVRYTSFVDTEPSSKVRFCFINGIDVFADLCAC